MGSCQTRKVNEFTLKAERERFAAEKTRFIDSVFALVPDSTNEKAFTGAFWASELMLTATPGGEEAVRRGLRRFNMFTYSFKRSLLQNAYTLYLPDCFDIIDSLITAEKDEKLFAMMAEYILSADSTRHVAVITLMRNKFPQWESHPVLKGLVLFHSGYATVRNNQLDELIRYRQNANEASVYVIVSKNRDFPGYAIIQDDDGHIIKEKNDTLRIKLLARSVTNLPGYLTNGNTPTGVFSMQATAVSDNIFIGPSPVLITFLPFEADIVTFSFGKQLPGQWTKESYNCLYPASWRSIAQKDMAYYAGEAGRSEIILHGTAIDEDYYRGQPYFPFTPSLGCLSTLEIWDRERGVRLDSEQMKMIKTLKRHRIDKALVYIIEK